MDWRRTTGVVRVVGVVLTQMEVLRSGKVSLLMGISGIIPRGVVAVWQGENVSVLPRISRTNAMGGLYGLAR